jgi:FkbM family methyltransferase
VTQDLIRLGTLLALNSIMDTLGLADSRFGRRLSRLLLRPTSLTDKGVGSARSVRLGGIRLHVPLAHLRHYLVKGYEPLTRRALAGRLQRGMTFLDVGAHVGYFTLLAARSVGPTGRVTAVEPATDNVKLLRQNVDRSGFANIVILEGAAGATHGVRDLNITDSSDSHSFYSHPSARAVSVQRVEQIVLDDVIRGSVNVAKIDVEGAEIEVLRGMVRLIRDSRQLTLVVEWNPECAVMAGNEPEAVPLWLRKLGFSVRVLDEKAGKVRTVDEVLVALKSGQLPKHWYCNILAEPGRDSA